jgi:hypothetical protein
MQVRIPDKFRKNYSAGFHSIEELIIAKKSPEE